MRGLGIIRWSCCRGRGAVVLRRMPTHQNRCGASGLASAATGRTLNTHNAIGRVLKVTCNSEDSILQLHGELVGGEVGGGGGFGGEGEDEAFEDEEFVGGGATEFEVGLGDEAEGAGKRGAGFVAAGLADEVFGGEGRHAEALP
jgi:hypothetical protein